MKEKEVIVNGKTIKVISSCSKEYIENNDKEVSLDDTIDLDELIKEISSNENEKC